MTWLKMSSLVLDLCTRNMNRNTLILSQRRAPHAVCAVCSLIVDEHSFGSSGIVCVLDQLLWNNAEDETHLFIYSTSVYILKKKKGYRQLRRNMKCKGMKDEGFLISTPHCRLWGVIKDYKWSMNDGIIMVTIQRIMTIKKYDIMKD